MQGSVNNQPCLSFQFHFKEKDRHHINARTLFSCEWGILLLTEELGKMMGVEVKTYVQARKEGSFVTEYVNMLPQAVDIVQNSISPELFNYILSTIIEDGCTELIDYIKEQSDVLGNVDSFWLAKFVLDYYMGKAIGKIGDKLYGLIFGEKGNFRNPNNPNEANKDNRNEDGNQMLLQLSKEKLLELCAKLHAYAQRIRNAMQKDDTITGITISMKFSDGDVLTYEIKNTDNDLPKLPVNK